MTMDELNALYNNMSVYGDTYTSPTTTIPTDPNAGQPPILEPLIPGLPIVQQLGKPYDDNDGGIKALAGMDYGYDSVFDNTNITPKDQPQTNFEYDIEEGSIPQSDIDNLETAKNDTNVNNLINMGLFKQAEEYVKNNYGYMIMNLMFPGSGSVAKVFVDNKKKKEAAAAEELAKIEEEKIATLAKAEEEKKQEIIRQAAYEQARQDKETYAALEASITRGDGGQGYDRPDSGPTSVGAGMGVGGGYASDYGYDYKDGGRIGYGTGGIVSL